MNKALRYYRYFLLFLAVSLIVAEILLGNFTAPNPTGRRYSSESPVTTGQGSASQIGLSGEMILARDLGLPRNEEANQRQCACGSQSSVTVNECRVCLVTTSEISSYRRPDFVAANFIAESKNVQNLLYTGREVNQIREYALVARLLNRPLWIYTRVDSAVSREFIDIAESTGGGVVRYFSVPGYKDPVDQFAITVRTVTLSTVGLLVIIEVIVRRFKRKPPQYGKPLDHAEALMEKARERANTR